MTSETVTIRRIGPTSALKFGAVVGLVVGAIYFMLEVLSRGGTDRSAGRPVLLVVLVLIGIVGGGLSGLVTAWVYNVALNLTGGLRLQVAFERDGAGVARGVPPSIGSRVSYDE